MICKVKLKLSNGFYEIINGDSFTVRSSDTNHLIYEENGVWHVVSDPNGRSVGNSTIVIPWDFQLASFMLEGTNIGLRCDMAKAETVYFDLKNSAGEINNIFAKKIGISMGKGEVRANVKKLDSLKVDCGYGTVKIDIPYVQSGYCITSRCGTGEVMLNSMKLPREYTQNDGVKNINIVCGMGQVYINTYIR